MRVSFARDQVQRGLIRKTDAIRVTCTVNFTETELAALRKYSAHNEILVRFPGSIAATKPSASPVFRKLRLDWLMLGNIWDGLPIELIFGTPMAANTFEAQLTNALRDMSALIEENTEPQNQTRQIEL